MDVLGPLRNLTISSILVGSVLYHVSKPPPHLYFSFDYHGFICMTWIVHLFVWIFYRVVLQPKFLSPLRHLPEPTVSI